MIDLTKLLIEKGARVDEREQLKYGGRTPLAYAAQNNNLEIMEILLKAGADVNYDEQSGYRILKPLHQAFRNDHFDAVSILLAWHGDPNSVISDGYSSKTPIEFANPDNEEIIALPYIATYAHKILRESLLQNSSRDLSKEEKQFMTEIVTILLDHDSFDKIFDNINSLKIDEQEQIVFNAVQEIIIEIVAYGEINKLENKNILPKVLVDMIKEFHSEISQDLYQHSIKVFDKFTLDRNVEVKNILDNLCNKIEEKSSSPESNITNAATLGEVINVSQRNSSPNVVVQSDVATRLDSGIDKGRT